MIRRRRLWYLGVMSFVLSNLPAGAYQLQVSTRGFRTFVQAGLGPRGRHLSYRQSSSVGWRL